jgi:hypothetical protein
MPFVLCCHASIETIDELLVLVFFSQGPMNVSKPSAIGFATTWVVDVSSTVGVGEKFDVHRKVQLPLKVVMDPCPSH